MCVADMLEGKELIIHMVLAKSYSTIDNLFCLQTLVTKYLKSKGKRFYAVFVDFEKAFDRIDINALWNKLQFKNE